LNDCISELDFYEWIGCDKTPQFMINVTELGKNQILDNQNKARKFDGIVDEYKSFKEKLEKIKKTTDWEGVLTREMLEEILGDTIHSKGEVD